MFSCQLGWEAEICMHCSLYKANHPLFCTATDDDNRMVVKTFGNHQSVWLVKCVNRIKIYCELYSYVCGLSMYEEVYTPHLAVLSLHRHIQMYMYPSLSWPQRHLTLSAISYSCSTTSAVQQAMCRFYATLCMCRCYTSLPKDQFTNQPTIYGVDAAYHDFRDVPSIVSGKGQIRMSRCHVCTSC